MRNREKLAAGSGPVTLVKTTAEQQNVVAARQSVFNVGRDYVRQDEWRAQTRAALGRAGWRAANTLLTGIVLTAVAFLLIDHYPDSGPTLFAVQLAMILVGPLIAFLGLAWVYLLTQRRRAIRRRTWREVPARAATLHVGPFWLTTVGLTLPSGMTWVIFPEQLWRSRIRRLVERDGRLLVLLPRSGHVFDRPLFAGANGSPVFADQPRMADAPGGYWERRALRALRSTGRAPLGRT